ncbi:actin filament-associated protein 1-like 2 isoform X1 [Polyodon spathula]|uniref:actin filament-associated protein 1-like 2 isoform X1 n=2 Tax=Polyodon spathula TaxID=7913 RepID=UPI001B7E6CFF|nr:actin filament-associated protein 1-like 2 isoform X1 [Polyodon spathula]
MDKQKVELNQLISDLQSFLLVLDRENLSYIAQAKKKSISDLLSKLQDQSTEDAEYMIMNCPSGATNSDLSEAQVPDSGSNLLSTLDSEHSEPSSSPAEWLLRVNAVPTVPCYPLETQDDDCYEEAEPFNPASQSTECVDSDSSHYESYGEEEGEEDYVKDRAHYIQCSSSLSLLRPVPESRICGFLWRKKWLGQWSKQLFIVRNHLLLCYKCAKDLQPLLELNLRGCQLVYKSKHNKKMQHELKVTAGSDCVVMGFQSYEQAEEWRKIIEEVRGSSCNEKEAHGSSCLLKSDKRDSCRASGVLHTGSQDEGSSAQPTAFNSTEITHKGFLNVLMNCQWQSLWCHVENDLLQMSRDAVCEESPQYCIHLSGCEIRPGPDTSQGYRITVSQHGTDMAVLEASSAEHKECWFHLLQAGSLIQSESGLLYEPTNTELPGHSTSTHSFSGLMGRRFPAPNMYIDDPFHQLHGASHADPVYSNTGVLEHMFQNSRNDTQTAVLHSKDSNWYGNNEVFAKHVSQTLPKLEEKVQKLDVACRTKARMKAGSELNLLSLGKAVKHTSFRQSLAFNSTGSEGSFLSPLLRRTVSAKSSLKRTTSSILRRKEWETKAPV